MANIKFDVTKILSIAGAALGLAGTVVAGIASDKKMAAEVANQVAKAIQNQD